MTPYFEAGGVTLYHGDCLEVMRWMAELGIMFDAAIADPPYHRIVDTEWDKQHKDILQYTRWLTERMVVCKRVLSNRGSLYVFGDDKNIAYIQVGLDEHFTLLNNLVWFKTNNKSIKYAPNLRSYAPMTERILFYTKQLWPTGLETVKLDVNNFVTLREYFRKYQKALGLSLPEINKTLGHRKAEHAFYWNSTQWDLPTPETYKQLGDIPTGNGFVRREYESLRREYESLRRVFNSTNDTLDVISGPIVTQKDNNEHPTTKPLWIIKRLILDSTSPGFAVLDPFAGGGTTAIAAIRTGRRCTLIEIDERYCEIAVRRIERELQQPRLLVESVERPQAEQIALFDNDSNA